MNIATFWLPYFECATGLKQGEVLSPIYLLSWNCFIRLTKKWSKPWWRNIKKNALCRWDGYTHIYCQQAIKSHKLRSYCNIWSIGINIESKLSPNYLFHSFHITMVNEVIIIIYEALIIFNIYNNLHFHQLIILLFSLNNEGIILYLQVSFANCRFLLAVNDFCF